MPIHREFIKGSSSWGNDEMRDDTLLCHVAMYQVPRIVSCWGMKAFSYMIFHFIEDCIKRIDSNLRLWLQLFDTRHVNLKQTHNWCDNIPILTNVIGYIHIHTCILYNYTWWFCFSFQSFLNIKKLMWKSI